MCRRARKDVSGFKLLNLHSISLQLDDDEGFNTAAGSLGLEEKRGTMYGRVELQLCAYST